MNDENKSFDPLDMSNYKVERLPKMNKSPFEIWMARLGVPLAIIAFVVIYFSHIAFIDNMNFDGMADTAVKRFNVLGADGFIKANYAMLAIFVSSLILWITEAIPNYLTSLLVILSSTVDTGPRIALVRMAGSQITGFRTIFGICSIDVPSPCAIAPPTLFSR